MHVVPCTLYLSRCTFHVQSSTLHTNEVVPSTLYLLRCTDCTFYNVPPIVYPLVPRVRSRALNPSMNSTTTSRADSVDCTFGAFSVPGRQRRRRLAGEVVTAAAATPVSVRSLSGECSSGGRRSSRAYFIGTWTHTSGEMKRFNMQTYRQQLQWVTSYDGTSRQANGLLGSGGFSLGWGTSTKYCRDN